MGSVVLPHLRTGWHVDQAILSEEDRLVVIRFGRDHDQDCMRQDEVLYKVADKVKNFAVCLPSLTHVTPSSLSPYVLNMCMDQSLTGSIAGHLPLRSR